MNKRPLGKTGIDIAPIVFGGNVFGWTIDEARSFAVLDAFVDHGFNAIDTAWRQDGPDTSSTVLDARRSAADPARWRTGFFE